MSQVPYHSATAPGCQYFKLFSLSLTERQNKLECLLLASLSNIVYYFRVWPGACPRREHLKGTPLGQAPASLANIGLGWKGSNIAYFASFVTDKGKKVL
jgi:hypothetical protein